MSIRGLELGLSERGALKIDADECSEQNSVCKKKEKNREHKISGEVGMNTGWKDGN